MSDLRDLLRAVAEVRRKQKEFLLTTVTRALPSASRRPGARIVLARDRWIAGSVTGRAEPRSSWLRDPWWRTRENAPEIIRRDSPRWEDLGWGSGLEQSGVLEVLVERIGPRTTLDPLAFIEQCVVGQIRGAIATVIRSSSRNVHVGARVCVRSEGSTESNGMPASLHGQLVEQCRLTEASGITTIRGYEGADRPSGSRLVCAAEEGDGSVEVFVEAIVPPPRLFVFGAGPDAAQIANLARVVGWDVFACVRRARFETRARFATADAIVLSSVESIRTFLRESDRALAVVMTHHRQTDKDALSLLLRSPARYIGVLGPRRRTATILAELGYDIDHDHRIHTPVGFALGAETRAEIALATIAEAQAALRSGAHPRSLATLSRLESLAPGGPSS